MSSPKGWPSQKKITYSNETFNEFNTVQPLGSDKNGMDIAPKSAFRATALDQVEAGSTENIIIAAAHGARVGDFVRFESGTLQFWEVAIVKVDTNNIWLGTKLPSVPGTGDDFYIMRYTTPRVDTSGSIVASSGPVQFVKDAVDTQVSEDTVTPANSESLPVGLFATTGERILTPIKPAGLALGVDSLGKSPIESARLDYAVTNVDNAAWTEVIASVGECSGFTLFDSGGYTMEIGIGAAAAETRYFLVPPGGFNGVIPMYIANNTRISVRAVGAALVNLGELIINFME